MDGLFFYNFEDIVFIEADGNYSTLHFRDQSKRLTTRTLRDFEEMLPGHLFFRPHHSYIVNLNYIKRYIKGDGGQIELQGGHLVDVSRSKKAEFMKIIS